MSWALQGLPEVHKLMGKLIALHGGDFVTLSMKYRVILCLTWVDFDLDAPVILHSYFGQSAYLISIGRSGQTVEQPQSKSTQPRSGTC